MNKNFTFFAILASVLIGSSFGLFSFENSFADDDNLSVSREDSKAYQKQLEKLEKEREKAEERKQKLEEKKAKLDLDRKKLEERLFKKINKYEEKLKEIKIKYQNKIESGFTGNIEKFSDKIIKQEDKIAKKNLMKSVKNY